MLERVHILREKSISVKPYISTERAELATDFYQTGYTASAPVTRAEGFKYILIHKTIFIDEGVVKAPSPLQGGRGFNWSFYDTLIDRDSTKVQGIHSI